MNTDYLEENPDYIEEVEKIIEYEENNDDGEADSSILKNYNDKNGCDLTVKWSHKDVGVHPTRLYQLEMNGFLERVFDSNNQTLYSIPDRARLKRELNEITEVYEDGVQKVKHEFPDKEDIEGVFSDVVGYNDVKWLMKKAMASDDIVNVVLVGPPGSGKTVFLRCIRKMEDAAFISGRRTSESGFTDKMFEETPRYMCIDELDDMRKEHQVALSDYTEEGRIVETKGNNKRRELVTNTKTFASANSLGDVVDQIEDRFTDLHFDRYTLDEFEDVCVNILSSDYGASPEHSRDIAEAVWDMEGFGNVRKAEDVAALSDGDDPERVIRVLEDYSGHPSM